MPNIATTKSFEPTYPKAKSPSEMLSAFSFDFLTKPIDFVDLETTIERTLRHVEALRVGRRR